MAVAPFENLGQWTQDMQRLYSQAQTPWEQFAYGSLLWAVDPTKYEAYSPGESGLWGSIGWGRPNVEFAWSTPQAWDDPWTRPPPPPPGGTTPLDVPDWWSNEFARNLARVYATLYEGGPDGLSSTDWAWQRPGQRSWAFQRGVDTIADLLGQALGGVAPESSGIQNWDTWLNQIQRQYEPEMFEYQKPNLVVPIFTGWGGSGGGRNTPYYY